jgi:hypothetical protein
MFPPTLMGALPSITRPPQSPAERCPKGRELVITMGRDFVPLAIILPFWVTMSAGGGCGAGLADDKRARLNRQGSAVFDVDDALQIPLRIVGERAVGGDVSLDRDRLFYHANFHVRSL